MKKRIKRRRFYLIRPADALLPLSFLASELFGPPHLKGWLFAAWLSVRVCALFSADSLRMAYATQPGFRQVRGSTTLALLMQFIGAGVAAGVYTLIFHGITGFTLAIIGIGLALNIEYVFSEYLRSEGDAYNANLITGLTAALLFAGTMLERVGIPLVTLCVAWGACLISAVLAACAGGYRPAKINVAVLKHAPRAMMYGLAYPALIIAVQLGLSRSQLIPEMQESACEWMKMGMMAGFYAGLAVIQTVRTPFRRSSFESRTIVPVLIAAAAIICGAWAILYFAGFSPVYVVAAASAFMLCMLCAVVISMALWGNLTRTEY